MGKVMELSTSMIAFSTFLGVLIAMIYYLYQIIKKISPLEAIGITVTYININLLFFLAVRGRLNG